MSLRSLTPTNVGGRLPLLAKSAAISSAACRAGLGRRQRMSSVAHHDGRQPAIFGTVSTSGTVDRPASSLLSGMRSTRHWANKESLSVIRELADTSRCTELTESELSARQPTHDLRLGVRQAVLRGPCPQPAGSEEGSDGSPCGACRRRSCKVFRARARSASEFTTGSTSLIAATASSKDAKTSPGSSAKCWTLKYCTFQPSLSGMMLAPQPCSNASSCRSDSAASPLPVSSPCAPRS